MHRKLRGGAGGHKEPCESNWGRGSSTLGLFGFPFANYIERGTTSEMGACAKRQQPGWDKVNANPK